MIPCPERVHLQRLLEGGLSKTNRVAIEAHIETCDRCQAEMEFLTDAALPAEFDAALRKVPSVESSILKPPILPDIELLEVIGRGGSGRVWKGRIKTTSKLVAVKVLTGGVYADVKQQERFLREVEILSRLQHPGLIDLYHFGLTADGYYYSMKYLPAGSLADDRERNGHAVWSIRRAAEVLAAIASAIHYAHVQQVIHRDLKPGNILLKHDGQPVVADFGIAKLLNRPETIGVPVGTPCYMAPEQGTGRPVDSRTDVYGLGALLYDILTGLPPVPACESDADTIRRLCDPDERPVAPRMLRPDLPADLERVCLKCLEKHPANRYPSAAELTDELDRFLAGKPVLVRSLDPISRGWRWVKRNQVSTAVIVAATITAVAIATAGVFAFQAADERAKRVQREQEVGELLIASGSLRDTVRRLDGLTEGGIPLSERHRLLLVEALSEMGHLERATAELDQLTRQELIPEHRGRAALRRAELALVLVDPSARSQITAARIEKLSPDDSFYADALLAETVPEAVRHLEQAVGLNSRHVQARSLLAYLLLVGGRVDEAVKVAEQSRMIFTDHPAFPQVLTLAYAARGEVEKSRTMIEALADLRPAKELRRIRAVASAAAFVPRELRAQFYGPEHGHTGVTDAERALLVEAQRECEESGTQWLAEMRLPPAVHPSVAKVFRAFGRAVMGVPLGETRVIPENELNDFGDAVQRLPEGVATMLYGFGLLERANSEPSESGQALAVFRERLAASGQAFRSAADRPAWVDVRDIALVNAAVFYSVAGKPRRPPPVKVNAQWLAASVEAARARWQLGQLTAKKLGMLVRVSANGGWFALGRAMLDDLERMTGQETVGYLSRADLELKAGNYRAALTAVERVLKTDPTDQEAKRIQDECRNALDHPNGAAPVLPRKNN